MISAIILFSPLLPRSSPAIDVSAIVIPKVLIVLPKSSYSSPKIRIITFQLQIESKAQNVITKLDEKPNAEFILSTSFSRYKLAVCKSIISEKPENRAKVPVTRKRFSSDTPVTIIKIARAALITTVVARVRINSERILRSSDFSSVNALKGCLIICFISVL